MNGINIFISDKIRMHPLDFTADGLGMAGRPVLIFDLDIPDDVLLEAIQDTLHHSKTNVPHRPLTTEAERSYYQTMGVRSKKDLGIGADVIFKNQQYTITPINKKGLFGKPEEVSESSLVETVRECLGLFSANAG